MDTTKQMQDALVKEYMGGNQSRETELRALTKELVDYTLNKLGKSNISSESIVTESINGIQNIYHEGEFDAMVVKNVAKAVVSSIQGEFLSFELPEKYSKGVSYQYRNIREENESFIPASLGNDDFDYVWKFFENLKPDQKLLVVMYYLGEMSVEDIRNLTKARVFAISANLQFIKDIIKERVVERQMSPGGEFVSLSNKNILWIPFFGEFEKKIASSVFGSAPAAAPVEAKPVETKPVEEVKPVETKPVEEVKPIEVKPVEEKPVEELKPAEPVKEDKAPDWEDVARAPKPITPEAASKATKKKKSPIVPIAIVIILILLGITAWKVISVYLDKKNVNPTHTTNKSTEDQQFNEKMSKAAESAVGDVDVMLTYNVLTAPKAEVEESINGTTYRLDMTFQFKDKDGNPLEEKPVVSLLCSDLVEKYSADKYKAAKDEIIAAGKESFYTFDDGARTLKENRDWTPSDSHTATSYGKETADNWLSILGACLNTMGSSSKDGCDLIPLMPEHVTAEVNGKTYELVFYSAEGNYIQEDAVKETDGSSKNYRLAAKAYLKEI